jgi:acyl transferase domain-containing protein/acyl carrier protein
MSTSGNKIEYDGSEVAVIGMAGRFPGAGSIREFWTVLRDGIETIRTFSEHELEPSFIEPVAPDNPYLVKAGGVLDDAEAFDAAFFGFSALEAQLMDPQLRLFLECSWEALEDAGYCPEKYAGAIGVYAGATANTYLLNIYSNSELLKAVGAAQIGVLNNLDFLSTNVSYKLNLKGPSYTLLTACSTSLVATHVACQSLLGGECDIALAGGASVRFPQRAGYVYREGGILSPDGHCRAFDAEAGGTVFGNGVGVVALKRLADALDDGDNVYAVVKGSAINNDGALKLSFTAPRMDGQSAVILEALANAGVEARTINYIEAHGTGTQLGDAIEVQGLNNAFRAGGVANGACAIGSVKTNIGHLDAAAGIAGLIKTVLSLQHGMIPASLNFETASPKLDLSNSPFYVNTKLARWERDGDEPRRAGVSSFGIGGTNAHVILEERPAPAESDAAREWALLTLSAKTEGALERARINLSDHLKRDDDLTLADVAYTLQVGRKEMEYRCALVCRSPGDAAQTLSAPSSTQLLTGLHQGSPRPVMFMFPGQGAQRVNAGRELYESESVFREEADRCAELLKPLTAEDIRHLLFPSAEQIDFAQARLSQTRFAQPALFTLEYALAKLWMSWGVRPEAMLGHSLGEYVAACLAGVLSIGDALTIVARRGELMQSCPAGAMLAVGLSEEETLSRLNAQAQLSLAAVNSRGQCVVSGAAEEIEKLKGRLEREGVACWMLRTSHAFHSTMMDAVAEPFLREMERLTLNPPRIPYLSNLTGTWITPEQATDARYWVEHLRRCVRFGDSVGSVLDESSWLWLEVGPGKSLGELVNEHGKAHDPVVVASMGAHAPQGETAFLLNSLGQLWTNGAAFDVRGLYTGERRRRLPLPTYPFERRRFSVEKTGSFSTPAAHDAAELSKEQEISRWFYTPSWKRSTLAATASPESYQSEHWLVLTNDNGPAAALAGMLENVGQKVITARAGRGMSVEGERRYTINPHECADYVALLEELRAAGETPEHIVHLLNLPRDVRRPAESNPDARLIDDAFYSLLYLAQALDRLQFVTPLNIYVVSSGLHEITGEEETLPERAMLLGPCKVIPQEYSNVSCRSIDVVLHDDTSKEETGALAARLFAEIYSGSKDAVVAYRRNHRWVQTFEPLQVEQGRAHTSLRRRGVYLILGGLGRFGLVIAKYLGARAGARLILTSRSDFPERAAWEAWTASHDAHDPTSIKIRKLKEIEETGAEVTILRADVGDETEMRRVWRFIEERFGQLHGVIHAAGITGQESHHPIQETYAAECEDIFRSKVNGLPILESLLQDSPPDFCFLTSSLSPILGGLGLVAYSAANLFIDAFAVRANRAGRPFWKSINWEGWSRLDSGSFKGGLGAQIDRLLMNEEEIVEVFERILNIKHPEQIIVSTGDLQRRINQWIKLESVQGAKKLADGTTVATSSAAVNSEPAADDLPGDDVEGTIISICRSLLGVEEIGVNDNFFELGATSLVAVQFIARLREAFQQHVPLRVLFERPTVAGLAEVLRGNQGHEELDEISRILREVESLEADEVKKRLAEDF